MSEEKRGEHVHLTSSVFEKSFSTGTSWVLHHEVVILWEKRLSMSEPEAKIEWMKLTEGRGS